MAQTDKIQVINEVEKALDDILYGSVELYVQEGKVTQITIRHIKKTGISLGVNVKRTHAQNLKHQFNTSVTRSIKND